MASTGSRTRILRILVVFYAMTAYGEDLFSYLRTIALRQLGERKQRMAAIVTRPQFEERRAEVRRLLISMMGGLPEKRSPLNLRRTGTLDRGDYRIEKVIFESLPKVYVTADLYVPTVGHPPYAAVLQPLGHGLTGKTMAYYQTLSLGLVKQGFVVLTYDPPGQGERRMFFNPALDDSMVGAGSAEHSMVGIQSLLGGESMARYEVWDGIRAIDVLQSLPYVNANKIGISGCSGGGTLTAYLAALDDRLQAAAPGCYITDWEDQLFSDTGPQDAEQQFPDQFPNGLNHADLVEAFAPKPYLICSTSEDYFPIAGTRKAFDESKRIYELFGAGDQIATAYDSGPHGRTKKQREAVYAWMRRWLRDESGAIEPEPAFQTEHEEDLLATATGQVATSLGGETPSTLTMARLSSLKPPAGLTVEQLRRQIQRLTRWDNWTGPLDIRTSDTTESGGVRLTPLSYASAPGRRVDALLLEPARDTLRHKALLYLGEEPLPAAPKGDLAELAHLGYTILAVHPSGTGEREMNGRVQWEPWFRNQPLPWLALMVGKPLVGLRTEDILRGIGVLQDRGLLYGGVCLGFAKGRVPGADLLHAAVLDSRISSVTVEDPLLSYAAIGRTPLHEGIFEAIIPGVAGKYDLPDLAAALAPRALCLVNFKSPLGKPVLLREVRSEYERAVAAYAAAGAASRLRLGSRRDGESVADAYLELR